MADSMFVHRWLLLTQAQHPQVPERLLAAFAAGEGALAVETVATCLDCPPEDAASWCRYLQAHLIPPAHYRDVFASEDRLSERRMQWESFQADGRVTNARLAELDRLIQGHKAYAHLGEVEAAEVEEKLTQLDQERVDLLRHQADLPGVGAIIQQALTEAQEALAGAEETFREAQVAHLQDVEDSWLQEALALVEPARRHLHLARVLDQVWERLGVKASHDTGSGRLRDAALAALRR
jgi:hypothetical protein